MQATSLDFVAARMLKTKNSTWQIDLAEARTRFAQLNLLIGRKMGATPVPERLDATVTKSEGSSLPALAESGG